jgi:L-fucose isomerase
MLTYTGVKTFTITSSLFLFEQIQYYLVFMEFINRLKGPLPKIGIRPTIDGRRLGVRESLEDQTMKMAKTIAKLFESKLRHPTGHPIECVIADSTIGGVAEAAACADKFRRENVGVSLTVTPCWCYGSETMDMDPFIPKAVWGFNGTERPGAVYLAAVLAAHNQKGLPAFGIYGKDVQDAGTEEIPPDVEEKLLRFAKAGLAVAWMRGKSYLSIGGVSMGIAGSIMNPDFFESYLGMRCEAVDMSEVGRRLKFEIYDQEEFKTAMTWIKANWKEGPDPNGKTAKSTEQKAKELEECVKMTLIVRDLMVGNPKLIAIDRAEEAMGHNAILSGFQGQRNWTDWMPNGDFLEAILNSSFDWAGVRQPYIVATENDGLNGVAMLFGHLLTNTAQVFADVRTFWSAEAVKRVTGVEPTGRAKDGFIHLINSGPAAIDGTGRQQKDGKPVIKPFWEITPTEVDACMKAVTWEAAVYEYFRGGGFSTSFLSKGEMPITLSRINLIKGLGPVMQIAEGWTVELPPEVHKKLDQRTNWTWPTTWFVPKLTGKGAFKSVYDVMNNWGANHGAFSYGHIGADLISLASMLRIPVCMHNVDENKIFRPSTWSAFGTSDPESADFRACQNFGPLY